MSKTSRPFLYSDILYKEISWKNMKQPSTRSDIDLGFAMIDEHFNHSEGFSGQEKTEQAT